MLCYNIIRKKIYNLREMDMKNNLGTTRKKTVLRSKKDLRDYDSLPKNLREWLINAKMPWSVKSVKKIYDRVLLNTGDKYLAIKELDRIQDSNSEKFLYSNFCQ